MQWRTVLDNWGGGHISIFSCSSAVETMYFKRRYLCGTRIYEYMPPPPIIEHRTPLVLCENPSI